MKKAVAPVLTSLTLAAALFAANIALSPSKHSGHLSMASVYLSTASSL